MAEKKNLTSYQKGVIRRYYENREAISTQRLGELVSEIYLCESEKKLNQLWSRAESALRAAGVEEREFARIVEQRDVKRLADLVATIF